MSSPTVPDDASAHEQSAQTKTWHVGTLSYDSRGLMNVFFWMLWGDFCLNLMDGGVGTSLVLLQLQKYGASKIIIGLVQGTLIEFFSIAMVPIISTWSDRHRGPLGRRMPFMLYTAVPIALFLTLMGFAANLVPSLQRHFPSLLGHVATGSLTVAIIIVTFIAYKFFDMFPQSVYYYLFADVIPHNLMGTFACLFRVFSTLGGMVFSWFMLPYCETNPAAICAVAAGLYLFAFVMLSLMVKEGEYPPPPVNPLARGSLIERVSGSIAQYCKEVFLNPYYWTLYLFYVCSMIGIRGYG